jgi:predicted AAA+ superfamily ATPase
MCPALCTFARGEIHLTSEERGRLFELAVGLDLIRLPGDLYYWRNGNDEVDYIYRIGKKVFAIEVKSGRRKSIHGLTKFREAFEGTYGVIITPENYENFTTSPDDFLRGFF